MNDIDPKLWGPPAWAFIDYIVESYPIVATVDVQVGIERFLLSLADVLPCSKCRLNFRNFIETTRVSSFLESRDDLRRWLKMYRDGSKATSEEINFINF